MRWSAILDRVVQRLLHRRHILSGLLLGFQARRTFLEGPGVLHAEFRASADMPAVPEQTVLLLVRKKGLAVRTDTSAPWRWLVTSQHIFICAAAGDFRTFYVGTAYGYVWSTRDGGSHWQGANLGSARGATPRTVGKMLWESIQVVTVHPHNPAIVYAASNGKLYQSVDGGITWEVLSSLARRDSFAWFGLWIDPHDPSRMWRGTTYSGLLHSTDGGRRWSAVSINDAFPRVLSVAISSDRSAGLYVSLMQFPPNGPHMSGGLFQSTDGGHQWVHLHEGLPPDTLVGNLAISPCLPRRLYASERRCLYVSTDSGQTWTHSQGFPPVSVLNLVADPSDPLIAYASTSLGVWRTADGGMIWQDWNNGVVQADGTELGKLVLSGPGGASM